MCYLRKVGKCTDGIGGGGGQELSETCRKKSLIPADASRKRLTSASLLSAVCFKKTKQNKNIFYCFISSQISGPCPRLYNYKSFNVSCELLSLNRWFGVTEKNKLLSVDCSINFVSKYCSMAVISVQNVLSLQMANELHTRFSNSFCLLSKHIFFLLCELMWYKEVQKWWFVLLCCLNQTATTGHVTKTTNVPWRNSSDAIFCISKTH